MKNFIKGLICGSLIMFLITPIFAEDITCLFNQVRICVNGFTEIRWGENIDDNSHLPSSILYKDTTYVPLRFISESMGNDVCWNGDSKTVGITEGYMSQTLTLAEKADINGNIWKYTIETNDSYQYLVITDSARNYQRKYRMVRGNSYRVEEDSIIFALIHAPASSKLVRISFLNDENSQDGEDIVQNMGTYVSDVVFDGKYVYWLSLIRGMGTYSYFHVTNIETKEKNQKVFSTHHTLSDLELISSDEDTAKFRFNMIDGGRYPGSPAEAEINKKTLDISDEVNHEN